MARRGDRHIPCLIHIPGRYPDGQEVEPEKMAMFLEIFDKQFGGSTPLGIVSGRWLSNEKTIEEPMHRFEVAVKKKDLAAFEEVARLIGRETKQKVVYLVINYQAEVRFLFTDEGDPSPNENKAQSGSNAGSDEQPPQAESK